jgi:hypothetical protein
MSAAKRLRDGAGRPADAFDLEFGVDFDQEPCTSDEVRALRSDV